MLIKRYEINEQTILLTGINGRYRNVQTMIIDGNKTYRVNSSSEQIINSNLKNAGSCLREEIECSREYLGNLKMYPIKINASLGIYFFPSKSPKRTDCVWFSLIHVKKAITIGKNKTKVFLSFGHSIIIDCQLSALNNKVRRAQELRRMICEKEKCPITFFFESKKNFQKRQEPKKDSTMINDDHKDLSSGQNEN